MTVTFTTASPARAISSIVLVFSIMALGVSSYAQTYLTAEDDTLCLGESTRLFGSNATTYHWYDTTSHTAVTPLTGDTVIAHPLVNTVIRLIVDSGLSTADTAYLTLYVHPIPIVSLHRNKDTVCSGTQLVMWGTGASTYNWSYGTQTFTGDTLKLNPTVSTRYKVTGTSLGCTSRPDSFTTFIRSLPTVNFSMEFGNFKPAYYFACNGVNFNVRASGASTYSWTGPVTPTIGTLVTGNITATTPIQVVGTDAHGCSGTRSRNIIVNQEKKALSSNWLTDSVFCRGDSGKVEISGGNDDLFWTPTTGLSYQFNHSVTAKPLVTTTYTLDGIFLGCINTRTLTVTVNQPPTISLSQSSGGRALCRDEADTITITSPGILFDWGVGVFSTEKVKTMMPGKTTLVSITAYDAIGCGNTATITINVDPSCGAPLGVLSAHGSASLKMYVKDQKLLITEAQLPQGQQLIMKVINPLGSLVAEGLLEGAGSKSTGEINLSHLTTGVYVVSARQSDGKVYTQKIYVQ